MNEEENGRQFQVTRSCPVTPGILQLQEYVVLAGHWRTPMRMPRPRTMQESVLVHCVSGSAVYRLGTRDYGISTGDVFLCPPRTAHRYRSSDDEPWESWWCHFRGLHAESLCRAAGFSVDTPVLHPVNRKRLLERFTTLVGSLETVRPDTPREASILLHLLLVELHRQAGGNPVQNDLTVFADAFSISVEDMAHRAGFSKYHFCRRFKKQTGRSPWQYVLDCKVELAKELLVGSRKSIKEIAAFLAFDHPDYFARIFRERCGVTPGRYRGW